MTSLLLLEPIVVRYLFQELPGRGVLIAFILGTLGLVVGVML